MCRDILIFLKCFIILSNLFAATKANVVPETIELIDNKAKTATSDNVEIDVEEVLKTAESQNEDNSDKAAIPDEQRTVDVLSDTEFTPTEVMKDKRSTNSEPLEEFDEVKSDPDVDNIDINDSRDGDGDLVEKSGDYISDLKSEAAEDIERSAHDSLEEELKSDATADAEPSIDRIDGATSNHKSMSSKLAKERSQAEDRSELASPENIFAGSRRMLNNFESNSKSDAQMEANPNRSVAQAITAASTYSHKNEFNHLGGSKRSFQSDLVSPRRIQNNPVINAPVMNRPSMFYSSMFPTQSAPSTSMMVSRTSSSEAGPMGRTMTSKTRVVHNGVEVLNEERSEGPWNKAKPLANSYPYNPSSAVNPSFSKLDRQQILPQNNVDLSHRMAGAPQLSMPNLYSAENVMKPFPSIFNFANPSFPTNFNPYMFRSRRYATVIPTSTFSYNKHTFN